MAEAVPESDVERVKVSEPLVEPVALAERVPECDGDVDGLSDLVSEGDVDDDGDAVPVCEPVPDRVGEGESDDVSEREGVGLPDSDTVCVAETVDVREPEAELVPVPLCERVTALETLGVTLNETDGLEDVVPVSDTAPEADAHADSDADGLPVGDEQLVADAVAHAPDGDAELSRDTLGVVDWDSVPEPDMEVVKVVVDVSDTVSGPEPVREADTVPLATKEADAVVDRDAH